MNYSRTNYEMTKDDHAALLDACKSTPVMLIGGTTSRTPQENANAAWHRLGEKMGFNYMTVQPDPARGERFFTAIPLESSTARDERIARENLEAKNLKVASLESKIAAMTDELKKLTEEASG